MVGLENIYYVGHRAREAQDYNKSVPLLYIPALPAIRSSVEQKGQNYFSFQLTVETLLVVVLLLLLLLLLLGVIIEIRFSVNILTHKIVHGSGISTTFGTSV